MKIQGPHVSNALSPQRPDGRSGPEKAPANADADDRVRVSGGAQRLAAARAPETPDAARVDALKEAIADGRFEVDPRRIAEAMVKEER